ncbi:hypothetical protein KZ483_14885 [Paenibacillus sp. sptzw28]|uniref:hypothetical protein n=1 Tax=Paenibacillus sp. sptzw28 TaxID=715179 RepID=UPI001C6E0693|nr:hypothetical protein [Paenibacillus sp. sptzw28]QYR19237.1 hypothetical protein KZ483_14885 [Paenibacillus sp. sptzw28]
MEVVIGQTPIDLNELKQNLFTTLNPANGVLHPGQSLAYRICKPAFPVLPRSGHAGEFYYGSSYNFPYELETFLSVKKAGAELARGKDYNLEEIRTSNYTDIVLTPLLRVEQQAELTIQATVQVILNGFPVQRTFDPETITLLPTVSETFFQSFLAESTSTDMLRSGEYLQASLSTILQSLPEGATTDSFPIKTTMPINGKPTPVTIHSIRWEAYKETISSASAAAAAPIKLVQGRDFEAPDGLDKLTSRFLFLPQQEAYQAYASAQVLTECNGVTQTLTLITPTTTISSVTSVLTDVLAGFDLIPDSFHTLQPGQPLELKVIHKLLDLSQPFGNLNIGALSYAWKITGIVWELSRQSTSSAAAGPVPLALGKDFFLSDAGNPFEQNLLIQPSIVDKPEQAVPEVYELKGTVSYLINGDPGSSNPPIKLLIKQLPLVKENILSLFQVKSNKAGSASLGEPVLLKLVTPLENLVETASLLSASALPDLKWFPVTGGLPVGGLTIPFEIKEIAWHVLDEKGAPLKEGKDFRTLEGLSSLQTSLVFLPPKEWAGGAASLTRKVQAKVTAALNGVQLSLDDLALTFSNLNLQPFQDKILGLIEQSLQVTRNGDTLGPGTPLIAELASNLAKPVARYPAGFQSTALAATDRVLTGTLPFADDRLPFEIPLGFSVKLEWKLYKKGADGQFVALSGKEFQLRSGADNTSDNPWKDSRLDVLLVPQVKGFHQLTEIEFRYLEAALEISIPTLDPIQLSLPKIPIAQIPIAVPELLLVTEHRLDDLDQAGDRLIVLPQSTFTRLTNWDALKPVLETVNTQVEAVYGMLDGVTDMADFALMLLGLKDALGHVLQPIGKNKLWVAEAVGDRIADLGQLPKTDNNLPDDSEWDDEISGIVAIMPSNRKIRFYRDKDYKGDKMDVIPSQATNNELPFGNIVCILNNLNIPDEIGLKVWPEGTLDGNVDNDDIDSLKFLDLSVK